MYGNVTTCQSHMLFFAAKQCTPPYCFIPFIIYFSGLQAHQVVFDFPCCRFIPAMIYNKWVKPHYIRSDDSWDDPRREQLRRVLNGLLSLFLLLLRLLGRRHPGFFVEWLGPEMDKRDVYILYIPIYTYI